MWPVSSDGALGDADAGAVDRARERLPCLLHRRRDVGLGGHVGANERCLVADRRRRSLTACNIDVEAEDARTRAGELDGGGPSEPGSRSGDDECPAVDVHPSAP